MKFSEQYALTKIKATAAWNMTTGNSQIRVGIIDSGIAKHEDLNPNLSQGWDFFNDNSITTDDIAEHGTHVAGIIGAVGNNKTGISGVNWNISLVPLQTVNPQNQKHPVIKIVNAINYAANNQIPILNKSIAFYSFGEEQAAIENYQGLIVCSAGNDYKNLDLSTDYPKYYTNSNVICVAATDSSDQLWRNCGRPCCSGRRYSEYGSGKL